MGRPSLVPASPPLHRPLENPRDADTAARRMHAETCSEHGSNDLAATETGLSTIESIKSSLKVKSGRYHDVRHPPSMKYASSAELQPSRPGLSALQTTGVSAGDDSKPLVLSNSGDFQAISAVHHADGTRMTRAVFDCETSTFGPAMHSTGVQQDDQQHEHSEQGEQRQQRERAPSGGLAAALLNKSSDQHVPNHQRPTHNDLYGNPWEGSGRVLSGQSLSGTSTPRDLIHAFDSIDFRVSSHGAAAKDLGHDNSHSKSGAVSSGFVLVEHGAQGKVLGETHSSRECDFSRGSSPVNIPAAKRETLERKGVKGGDDNGRFRSQTPLALPALHISSPPPPPPLSLGVPPSSLPPRLSLSPLGPRLRSLAATVIHAQPSKWEEADDVAVLHVPNASASSLLSPGREIPGHSERASGNSAVSPTSSHSKFLHHLPPLATVAPPHRTDPCACGSICTSSYGAMSYSSNGGMSCSSSGLCFSRQPQQSCETRSSHEVREHHQRCRLRFAAASLPPAFSERLREMTLHSSLARGVNGAALRSPKDNRQPVGSGAWPRRQLIGSFEESLLSGRIAWMNLQPFKGFTALLKVTGQGRTSTRKVSFSPSAVNGSASSLYVADINVSQHKERQKQGRECRQDSASCELESRPGEGRGGGSSTGSQPRDSRIKIPCAGQVQLLLSNPEGTPIHTFLCRYDLADMLPNTKTFIRQRSNLSLPKPVSTPSGQSVCSKIGGHGSRTEPTAGAPTSLRYAMHLRFECTARASRCRSGSTSSSSNTCSSGNRNASSSSSSSSDSGSSISSGRSSSRGSSSSSCRKGESHAGRSDKANQQEEACLDAEGGSPFFGEAREKNEGMGDAKVEDEKAADRRLFLCGNIRIVFPLRTPDQEEGQLVLDHQVPDNPRYFPL